MDEHTWSVRSEEISIHFQAVTRVSLEDVWLHTIADFCFGRNEIDGAWYYVWRSSSREAARSSVPENGNMSLLTPLEPSSLSGKFVSRVFVRPPIFKFGAETRWQDARAAPAAERRSWTRQASSGSLRNLSDRERRFHSPIPPNDACGQFRVWKTRHWMTAVTAHTSEALAELIDGLQQFGAYKLYCFLFIYIILTILQMPFSSFVSVVKLPDDARRAMIKHNCK